MQFAWTWHNFQKAIRCARKSRPRSSCVDNSSFVAQSETERLLDFRMIGSGCRLYRSTGGWAEGQQFLLGQHARGLFGSVEDAIQSLVGGRDVVPREPVEHVGLAAHRADFHDLFEAERLPRDAAIDRVRQIAIAGAERLDDCGGVNARGRAERILAEDGKI